MTEESILKIKEYICKCGTRCEDSRDINNHLGLGFTVVKEDA